MIKLSSGCKNDTRTRERQSSPAQWSLHEQLPNGRCCLWDICDSNSTDSLDICTKQCKLHAPKTTSMNSSMFTTTCLGQLNLIRCSQNLEDLHRW